ncbi:TPA: hypothetical protein ACPVZG_000322 [Vibrio parahaemolyticus]|uniref:Lipoprotein n=1 Tax=Vibrio parahaemolyticus TaxID=670 RepID=A0AAW8Q0H3_VIBPH|nr:hypothetical protein [Vibrio parahaemolyticus]MDS1821570.1 hypothetical protein [Vibrio parahaemolyticus]
MRILKKGVIAALVGFICIGASAMDEDKVKHLATSSVIGFTANGIFQDYETALASCVAIGVAKEVYDQIDYRGFSGSDLAADALGCGIGVISSEFLGFQLGYKELGDAKMVTFNLKF